ncbi:zinc finger C2H2-type domain protein [Thermobaculum terrenum ATCC BAA-798]|uniref:Zinc finger C2H2-type domain protein n=1 Tax=Thermobaculum terrenum (strain ATCC BAA-798 / CCMEE 7001 / YNP1) TaxID=525904 RepID=D1CDW6_THET1|nr:zinc finger C2H2-type domain protein [Thermobaculum terrenum ATCC BAA-798]
MQQDHKYKCDVCHSMFRTLEELEEHGRQAHEVSSPDYPCPTCNKKFATLEELEKHRKNYHP